MELPAFSENYDRTNDRQTNQLTNQPTKRRKGGGFMGKLHFQLTSITPMGSLKLYWQVVCWEGRIHLQ